MKKTILFASMVLMLCWMVLPAFAAAEYLSKEVSIPNMLMEDFTRQPGALNEDVATGWTAWRVNDPPSTGANAGGDPRIRFFKDLSDDPTTPKDTHITFPDTYNAWGAPSTASQGMSVGRYLNSGMGIYGAAGIYRTVNVTPGKVYLFAGYIDTWKGGVWGIGQTYRPLFGINPVGSTDPGAAGSLNIWIPAAGNKYVNAGNANWMIPGGGGSSWAGYADSGFSGFGSAWAAENSTISLWAGCLIRPEGGGNVGNQIVPNIGVAPVWNSDHFEMDNMSLHEFDFIDPAGNVGPTSTPVNGVYNGDFNGNWTLVKDSNPYAVDGEGVNHCSPNWKIAAGWLPIGGGYGRSGGKYFGWDIGQDATTGSYALTRSRNGQCYMGYMQKVKINTPAGQDYAIREVVLTAKAKAMAESHAKIGIDPQGGTNPWADTVVWDSVNAETNVTTTWQNLTLRGIHPTSANQTITVFLIGENTKANGESNYGTGDYHGSSFDDVSLSVITPEPVPPTPPLVFTINFDPSVSSDETHRMKWSLSIPPTDPESGVFSQSFWIGTTAGGNQILGETAADFAQQNFEVLDIDLPAGNVYVTVKQVNGVGAVRTVTSSAYVVAPNSYNFTWNTNGEHISANPFSSDSPSVACGSDGVYIAWRDSDGKGGKGDGTVPWWNIPGWAGWRSGISFIKRSGSSWGVPTLIARYTGDMQSEGAGSWDPSLAIDSGGNVRCIYQNFGTYYCNQLMGTSSSGGTGWSNPSYYDLGAQYMINWAPKAVPGSNGTIYVACNRTSAEIKNANDPGSDHNYDPGFVTITDAGYNFEKFPGVVDSGDKAQCSPSIAVDASGNVFAVWPESGGLKFQKKVNGTWSAVSTLTTKLAKGRSGRGDYDIAVDSTGKIHVVYVENHFEGTDNTKPGVWYVTSTDGATWSARKYVSDGAWPMLRMKGTSLHMLVMTRQPGQKYKWRPRHLVINASTGKFTATRDIDGYKYNAQPTDYDASPVANQRVERTDYGWKWVTTSHIGPASFDVDNDGNVHLAWSNAVTSNDRTFFWVDYYNTKGDVPAQQCSSIGCLTRWGVDGPVWGGGAPKKPVDLRNKLVVAEGRIWYGSWWVPYVNIIEDDGSAGLRVLCPGNVDKANPGAGTPNEADDINVGDRINLTADTNPDYSSAITVDIYDDAFMGEPQVGRLSGGQYGIKSVHIEKVSSGSDLPKAPYIKGIAAGGTGLPILDQVENWVGTPTIGQYVTAFGKVTYANTAPVGNSGSDFVAAYIDDGSGVLGEYNAGYVNTNGRIPGVKVYIDFITCGFWPATDSFMAVTGVVSTERAIIGYRNPGNPDTGEPPTDPIYGQIRVIRPGKADVQHTWTMF